MSVDQTPLPLRRLASPPLPSACGKCRNGVFGTTTWSHDGPPPWHRVYYCDCPRGRALARMMGREDA